MGKSFDIQELRTGNHETYELLFTEWYVLLCGYAYSMLRDSDEAKDIVQKTFYTLWDQREKIEIHTSIKSYLYRMVHNNCLNKIRQCKIRDEHNRHIEYESNFMVDNTDGLVAHNELQKQIDEAINTLPPRCKEVFILSRYHQLSYAEIAKKMDISTNTVEIQIVKALRTLRIKLKDYLPLLVLMLLAERLN